ncbi:hypothetical protein NECAME_04526 [Necator americanus]|uniref:PHD-type domain-containing protein n=1 Tax=Necator americanus TaxID=51031 RepID=W2SQY9_NECAM|nr:hypothetical protein NECAME_04526 [Necator americanus]ETN72055.1 hypothetical protein NECAME_04526 [Necator americanus]
MSHPASNGQQMPPPTQSPSQSALLSSSPMQANKPSPGSNRNIFPPNSMRPPSNGSGHLKSEPSPASVQQTTSSDQMSMNSGVSASTTLSPTSCSMFGANSQGGGVVGGQPPDQGPPQPPNTNTPFPLVTHYDMPPAFLHLQESFQMRNPALQMYYKRRKTLLVLPYPNAPNLSNIAPVEPPTFAFLPHTKHYDVTYDRRYPMNPMSQGQPPMHSRQPVPSPQVMSPAFQQPQPPNKPKAPPVKKARSDSTDGGFPGMPSNSGMMMAPGCLPRPMQLPPEMSHYGGVPTSQMGMNPAAAGMQCYPGASPSAVPTSSTSSGGNTTPMTMHNGMYHMGVPHNPQSMNPMGMPQQMNDNRKLFSQISSDLLQFFSVLKSHSYPSGSQHVPVSGVYPNMSNGQMSTNDQQPMSSPRNQMSQPPYQQPGNQFDISPQCPKCLCLVSPTNRSVQCNGPCMRLFHQNCTGLLPRAFALLEEDPSAKWVCGACESSVL